LYALAINKVLIIFQINLREIAICKYNFFKESQEFKLIYCEITLAKIYKNCACITQVALTKPISTEKQ
jgi:hypothetical protein